MKEVVDGTVGVLAIRERAILMGVRDLGLVCGDILVNFSDEFVVR